MENDLMRLILALNPEINIQLNALTSSQKLKAVLQKFSKHKNVADIAKFESVVSRLIECFTDFENRNDCYTILVQENFAEDCVTALNQLTNVHGVMKNDETYNSVLFIFKLCHPATFANDDFRHELVEAGITPVIAKIICDQSLLQNFGNNKSAKITDLMSTTLNLLTNVIRDTDSASFLSTSNVHNFKAVLLQIMNCPHQSSYHITCFALLCRILNENNYRMLNDHLQHVPYFVALLKEALNNSSRNSDPDKNGTQWGMGEIIEILALMSINPIVHSKLMDLNIILLLMKLLKTSNEKSELLQACSILLNLSNNEIIRRKIVSNNGDIILVISKVQHQSNKVQNLIEKLLCLFLKTEDDIKPVVKKSFQRQISTPSASIPAVESVIPRQNFTSLETQPIASSNLQKTQQATRLNVGIASWSEAKTQQWLEDVQLGHLKQTLAQLNGKKTKHIA